MAKVILSEETIEALRIVADEAGIEQVPYRAGDSVELNTVLKWIVRADQVINDEVRHTHA